MLQGELGNVIRAMEKFPNISQSAATSIISSIQANSNAGSQILAEVHEKLPQNPNKVTREEVREAFDKAIKRFDPKLYESMRDIQKLFNPR